MAEQTGAPAIRLRGVRHAYRRVTALDGVGPELPARRLTRSVDPTRADSPIMRQSCRPAAICRESPPSNSTQAPSRPADDLTPPVSGDSTCPEPMMGLGKGPLTTRRQDCFPSQEWSGCCPDYHRPDGRYGTDAIATDSWRAVLYKGRHRVEVPMSTTMTVRLEDDLKARLDVERTLIAVAGLASQPALGRPGHW